MKKPYKKKIYLFYLSILLNSTLYSQNLVLNYSFQEQKECPSGIYAIENSIGWSSPMKKGTPDYYARCAKGKFNSIPDNEFGSQKPYEGMCYVGISHSHTYGYGNVTPNNLDREYLQGSLKNELTKGNYYKVRIKVSTAERSSHFLNSLHFSFTDKKIKRRYKNYLKTSNMAVVFPIDTIGYDNWNTYEGVYQATGKETFYQIGNIIPSYEIPIDTENPKFPHFSKTFNIYIYVDAVEITPLSKSAYLKSLENTYTYGSSESKPYVDVKFTCKNRTEIIRVNNTKIVKIAHIYYLLISQKNLSSTIRQPESITLYI